MEIMNKIKETEYHNINSNMLKYDFFFKLNTIKEKLDDFRNNLTHVSDIDKKDFIDITFLLKTFYEQCNKHLKTLEDFKDLTPAKLQVEEDKRLKKNEEKLNSIKQSSEQKQLKLKKDAKKKLEEYEKKWDAIQTEFLTACETINTISDKGGYEAGEVPGEDKKKINEISNDAKTKSFCDKIKDIETILKGITEAHQELDGFKKEDAISEKKDWFNYDNYKQYLSSMLPTLEVLIAYLNIKRLHGCDRDPSYKIFAAQKYQLQNMLQFIRDEIEIVLKIKIALFDSTTEEKVFKELYQKLDENEKKMLKVKKAFGYVLDKVNMAPETYGIIKYALMKISQLIDYMQIYRKTAKDTQPMNNKQHKRKHDIRNNKDIIKNEEKLKKPNTYLDEEIAMGLAQEEMDENKNKNVKKKLTDKEKAEKYKMLMLIKQLQQELRDYYHMVINQRNFEKEGVNR